MKKRKLLCLILSLCLMLGALCPGTSAAKQEQAPTGNNVYYIETYDQLMAHALIAQEECSYILNNDIYQEDNKNNMEIVISSTATFHLDLNGYKIERVTQGNDCALFHIKSGGVMTINDTSSPQTGYCSFSEGYADYHKAVFLNEGGELEILGGYYEIFSPYEQGECSILRTTSGYTNIYSGTFDSSSASVGDTISVGHDSYLYDTPYVVIFDGDFYGKHSNIDVTPHGDYLEYAEKHPGGALHPSVYVLGGNFYICKESNSNGFAYCNNGWGRVFVASGTVPYKCLNSRDQRFLSGTSKELFTQTIDDYNEGYYNVTAPPMIMAEGDDYHYRLINLCRKADVDSYDSDVYKNYKEQFDAIKENIDTVLVDETTTTAPEIRLENRTTDHLHINWYMCNESDYCGDETQWTMLGDIQNISQWTPDERPENGESHIIRCVVTNSDLSTYEDMLRISYEPLKKTETIEAVEIKDLTHPADGQNPDFDLTPAEDSFYINGIYWTDVTDPANRTSLKETDTFTDGHTYELEVWIRANQFYQFRTDSDDCLEITAAIGGKEAEVVLPGTPVSAELRLTFTPGNTSIPTTPTESIPPESTPDEITEPTQSTEPTQGTDPSQGSTDSTEPSQGSTDSTEPSQNTTTAPTETAPSKVIGILGDADENSKVNVKDATLIQKHIASLVTLSETGVILANVDQNASVNIKDATAIQKHVAGMVTGYPIGMEIAG